MAVVMCLAGKAAANLMPCARKGALPPLKGEVPSPQTGRRGFSCKTPQSQIGSEEPICASVCCGFLATGKDDIQIASLSFQGSQGRLCRRREQAPALHLR